MLKELTVKEALQLLAEKYPEPVKGYFKTNGITDKRTLKAVDVESAKMNFICEKGFSHKAFFIETPDEYRYMTQQECLDWTCLNGHKGYQVREKGKAYWLHPAFFMNGFIPNPSDKEYRTIQEIDGKIVYGEPQEFKMRVQS